MIELIRHTNIPKSNKNPSLIASLYGGSNLLIMKNNKNYIFVNTDIWCLQIEEFYQYPNVPLHIHERTNFTVSEFRFM